MVNVQDISLNGITYRVELRKADIDLVGKNSITSNFVMLRSYNFQNSVLYDTDLYFVDKEIFNEYVSTYSENSESPSLNLGCGLIFPKTNDYNSLQNGMSLNIVEFNQDMNDVYFGEWGSDDKDLLNSPLVYKIYNKKEDCFEEADVKCDLLRIYRPHTDIGTGIVVYCYTLINNIRVHILARDLSWYERAENSEKYTNAVGEFSSNHEFYNSYIDVVIPSLDYLFSGECYYIENLNNGDVVKFDLESKEEKLLYEQYKNSIIYYNSNKSSYRSLTLFQIPFYIEEIEVEKAKNSDNIYNSNKTKFLGLDGCTEKKVFVKHYVPEYAPTARKAQQKNALSVRFIPYNKKYSYIYYSDKTNLSTKIRGFNDDGSLVLHDTILPNGDQFFDESTIRLVSHIGFDDDGVISIINEFDYPQKGNKKLFPDFNSAYEYYYGVELKDYTKLIDDEDEDGWWDVDREETMQVGVVFEIFGDKFRKDRLYRESYGFNTVASIDDDGNEIESPQIDDFAFKLSGLFLDWSQYQGIVYLRCTFIDKYIGKRIYGNVCTLTKEDFKYMINDDVTRGQIELVGSSLKPDVTPRPSYIPSEIIKEENVMDKSKFNFLTGVRVNVVAPTIAPNQIINNNNSTINNTTTKIIYKPVFYKVHDVTNIKLRSGLTQNVGINLMDYMTKVDTFKMVINTITLVEYARNDNYVIFNIETDKITNATDSNVTSGEYHILNQDDEYITSGNWSVK